MCDPSRQHGDAQVARPFTLAPTAHKARFRTLQAPRLPSRAPPARSGPASRSRSAVAVDEESPGPQEPPLLAMDLAADPFGGVPVRGTELG